MSTSRVRQKQRVDRDHLKIRQNRSTKKVQKKKTCTYEYGRAKAGNRWRMKRAHTVP